MRPENFDSQDGIDKLLEKSWEDPPAHLEHQLLAIPASLNPEKLFFMDRFALMLNTILILWGAGMLIYFWRPIEVSILTISRTILSYGIQFPELLSQPFMVIVVFVFILVGWAWLDLDEHPGTS